MNRALISWQQIGDLGELLTERCPVGSSAEVTVFKQNSDQRVGFMALPTSAHDKEMTFGWGLEIR